MNELVEFIDEVCGMYFRSILLPLKGIVIPTHKHPYDHATLIGSGRARLYSDGIATEHNAGEVVELKAHVDHTWESLEPNTRLTCVHDRRSAEFIQEAGL